MITKTITLHTYDELSPTAQEVAREWYRSALDSSDYESVIEDAVQVLEILGVTVRTHDVQLRGGKTRKAPSVWWQLGYMQSDGAAFEGTYSYAKGAHRKIREHAPKDAQLYRIACDLWEIQRRYRYGIELTIRQANQGFWPVVEAESTRTTRAISAEDEQALRELVKDLYRWIYAQLRAQDEYLSSEAYLAEVIRDNGYTFTEGGEREDV